MDGSDHRRERHHLVGQVLVAGLLLLPIQGGEVGELGLGERQLALEAVDVALVQRLGALLRLEAPLQVLVGGRELLLAPVQVAQGGVGLLGRFGEASDLGVLGGELGTQGGVAR